MKVIKKLSFETINIEAMEAFYPEVLGEPECFEYSMGNFYFYGEDLIVKEKINKIINRSRDFLKGHTKITIKTLKEIK